MPGARRAASLFASATLALSLSACEELNEAATVVVLAAGGIAVWSDEDSSDAGNAKVLDLTVESPVASAAGTSTGEVRVYHESSLVRTLGIGVYRMSFLPHQRITLVADARNAVAAACEDGCLASWDSLTGTCAGSDEMLSCAVPARAGPFSVTAVFGRPVQMDLSVQGAGMLVVSDAHSGAVTETATVQVAEGSRLRVEAVATPGVSAFSSWVGGLCQGRSRFCEVVAADQGQVGARFDAASQLSVSLLGAVAATGASSAADLVTATWVDRNGSTITQTVRAGETLVETLPVDTMVTLAAVASGTASVVSWLGDCAATGAAVAVARSAGCTLRMSARRDAAAVFGGARQATLRFADRPPTLVEADQNPPPELSPDLLPRDRARRQLRWRLQGASECAVIDPDSVQPSQSVPVARASTIQVFAYSGYRSEFERWERTGGCAQADVGTLPSSCQRASASCVFQVADSAAANTLAAHFVAATRLQLALDGTGTVSVRVGERRQSLVDVLNEGDLRLRHGMPVDMLAAPESGSWFGLWVDDAGADAPCSSGAVYADGCGFVMDRDRKVTAVFVPAIDLLLSAAGGGRAFVAVQASSYDVSVPTNTGRTTRVAAGRAAVDEVMVGSDEEPREVPWPANLPASVVARASTDSVFVEWRRAETPCTDTGQRDARCTVAVASSPTAVAATVVPADQLSVLLVGAGESGPQLRVVVNQPQEPDSEADFNVLIDRDRTWTRLARSLDSTIFTRVTLTAVPNNAHFAGWSGDAAAVGDCDPEATLCEFNLVGDVQAVASFASPVTLTLTVNQLSAGPGLGAVRVSSQPRRRADLPTIYGVGIHDVSVPVGARVILSAEPGADNMFIGWPDGDPSLGSPPDPDTAPCEALPDGDPDLPGGQRECVYDATVAHAVTVTFEAPRVLELVITGSPHLPTESAGGTVDVAGPLAVSGSSAAGPYAKASGNPRDASAMFWTRADRFNGSDKLTLAARPVQGAIFTGWAMAPSALQTTLAGDGLDCARDAGADGQCNLSLGLAQERHRLVANFEFIRHAELHLTMEDGASGAQLLVEGARINGSGSALAIDAEVATLQASASLQLVGYRDLRVTARAGDNAFFSHWERETDDGAEENSCPGTDPESVCAFPLLDADLSLRARFRPLGTLTVRVSGETAGSEDVVSVSGGRRSGPPARITAAAPMTLRAAANEPLTLTAIAGNPDTTRFVRWTGDCAGSSDCALSLSPGQAAVASAVFATLRTVRLRMSEGGLLDVSGAHEHQYIGPLDETFQVPDGERLMFTVPARALSGGGSHFAWEGLCAPANVTGTVSFDRGLSMYVNPTTGGSICEMTVSSALLSGGEIPVGVAFGVASSLGLALRTPQTPPPTSMEDVIGIELAGMLFSGPVHHGAPLSAASPAADFDVLPGTTVTLTAAALDVADPDWPSAITERRFVWSGDVCDGSTEPECRFAMPASNVAVSAEVRSVLRVPLALFGVQLAQEGTLTWSVADDPGSGVEATVLTSGTLTVTVRDFAVGPVERTGVLYALTGSSVTLRVDLAEGSEPLWDRPPVPSTYTLTIGAMSDCAGTSTRFCELALDGPDFTRWDARALRVTLPPPTRIPLALVAPQYGAGDLTWRIEVPGVDDVTGSLSITPEMAASSPSFPIEQSGMLVAPRGSSVTLRVVSGSAGPVWDRPPVPSTYMLTVSTSAMSDCASTSTRLCELALKGADVDLMDGRALRVLLPSRDFQLRVIATAFQTTVTYGTPQGQEVVVVDQSSDTTLSMPSGYPVSVVSEQKADFNVQWSFAGAGRTFLATVCPRRDLPLCTFIAPFSIDSATIAASSSNGDFYLYSRGCAQGARALTFNIDTDPGPAVDFSFVSNHQCGAFERRTTIGTRDLQVSAVDAGGLTFSTWHWSDGVNRCSSNDLTENPCTIVRSSLGYNLVLSALFDTVTTPGSDYGGALTSRSAGTETLTVARRGAGAVRVYAHAEATALYQTRFDNLFINLEPDDPDVSPLEFVGELVLTSALAANMDFTVPENGIIILVADPLQQFLGWHWPGSRCHASDENPCSVDLSASTPTGGPIAAFTTELDNPAVVQEGPGAHSFLEGFGLITAVPYLPEAFKDWSGDCEPGPSQPLECFVTGESTVTVMFHPFLLDGIKSLAFGLGYQDEAPGYFKVSVQTPDDVMEAFRFERLDPNPDPNPALNLKRLSVPVHLLPWGLGSYLTEACDASGNCMPALGGQQTLERSDVVATMGFFKAPVAGTNDRFGEALALSADGATLAVGASNEDSSYTGVFVPGREGYQDALDDDSVHSVLRRNPDFNTFDPDSEEMVETEVGIDAGAAYVYSRLPGSWQLEAFVKAPNASVDDLFGSDLALSGDGGTLAVGAPREDSSYTGTFAPGGTNYQNALDSTGASTSGAAYVYRRSGSEWSLEAFVKAPNTGGHDQFGQAVSLSAGGTTLAVGAPSEDSGFSGAFAQGGTNYQNALNNNNINESGAAYVYSRSGSTWSLEAFIKAPRPDNDDRFGGVLSLSDDGATLAIGAFREDSSFDGVFAPGGTNYQNALNSSGAHQSGAAYVYSRSGSTWSLEAFVKAPNSGGDDRFGSVLALSADGAALAVGAPREDSSFSGVFAPGGTNYQNALNSSGADGSGAAYVYRRLAGDWQIDAFVKAAKADAADWFGFSLDLSSGGVVMAVASSGEDSSFSGGVIAPGNPGYQAALNNDILGEDSSPGGPGAAYVYRYSNSAWSVGAFIKPFNPTDHDVFGLDVALSSEDGSTLAVSALREDSRAHSQPVDGGSADTAGVVAPNSGAVYLY